MQARETAQVEHPVCSNPPHTHHVPVNHNNFPAFQLMNPIPNPLYHFEMTKQLQEFNFKSHMISCFSNNSTSDEAEEQHNIRLMNERKQRRMISNRESARRSRMRKQKQLDELSSQLACLRNESNQLMYKLNSFSEKLERALHENANLKEEASCLRRMITDMQLGSPYCILKDHPPCTALLEENLVV